MVPTRNQQQAVDLSKSGHSFFLTGKGGTGKTFVLRAIYEELTRLKRKVYITCTTGIACNNLPGVGASTLHSFAGIKDGRGSTEVLFNLVKNNSAASQRWIDVDTLVIDEISMLSKHVFESLEYIARKIRGNEQQFGGIQIITSGDFYQLPPVHHSADIYSSNEYAFESKLWNVIFPHSVQLHEVVRQSDIEFIQFLNNIREGIINDNEQEFVQRFLANKILNPDDFGVEFIPEIFCTNDDVDYTNHSYLEELPGDPLFFKSEDTGSISLLNRCTTTPENVQLKVGARVILTANIGQKLVNGTQGTVTGFAENNEPIVSFPATGIVQKIKPYTLTVFDERNRDVVLAQRIQIPLKLGWAISVHKSQDMSLSCAVYRCGREFAPGQLYVALSRVTSKDGLHVKNFPSARKIPVPKRVKEFYSGLSLGVLEENCSCCRRVKTPEHLNIDIADEDLEALFREVDDEAIQKSLEDMFEVDQTANHDDEHFVDLDEVIETLASDENIMSRPPEDFQFVAFLNAMKYADTSLDNFRLLFNTLINELEQQTRVEKTKKMIILAWRLVYDTLKVHVLSAKKIEKRHFTNYVGMLHLHLTSDKLKEHLESVLEIPRISFKEHHFSFCSNLVIAINSFILNMAMAESEMVTNRTLFVDVTKLNDDAKGKIRYCGGWAISREREATRKRLKSAMASNNSNIRKGARYLYFKLALLNALSCPISVLQDTTKMKESLEVTDSRQFRGMGLTHITDHCFDFFMALEQRRIDLINSNRLRSLKDDLIVDSLMVISNDADLKNKWERLFTDENNTETVIIDHLYNDVVKRYLNMGSAQFLRDLRRDLNVQKTEAHRKKSFEKSKQREQKGAKVCLEDILKDQTPNKEDSHKLLQAMLVKYPDILASRIYTKQELCVLCDLYGLQTSKSSDKPTLSTELVHVIKRVQHMRNQGDLPNTVPNAPEVPSINNNPGTATRKRFRPSDAELAILRNDSTNDFIATAESRARQFGVSKKQILDWHKRNRRNNTINNTNEIDN